MDWIEDEAIRLFCPCLADVFVGRQAFQGLEPAGEVVGRDEVGEMAAQLVVGFVVVAFDRRFLEGSVHALDLAVGQGWWGLVSRCSMACRQARSKGRPRHIAVGFERFFGRSANWIPLSVSTVWTL